ncbi:MAG: T9SS C-terminal target domain-containing protein, partial [Bacteroidetes bacterium]
PIADQFNQEGDVVALQVVAQDPEGTPLIFGADGLPPGLGIDGFTGLIQGTIEPGAATGSPYLVTLYAYDGELISSVEFLWQVEAPPCPLPEITAFFLVNADANIDMYELQQGDTIALDELNNGISIRAELCGLAPDSVVLTMVEDTLHRRGEENPPYALFGDIQGNYFPWPASAGTYTLTATPYQNGQPYGLPLQIQFTVTGGQVCTGEVLFVVGDQNLNVGDQAAKNRLEQLGFQVETIMASQAQTADALDKSLVVISATVFSVHIGNKFSDVPVPVMSWEAYVFDDLGLTGPDLNIDYQFIDFQTSIEIQDPAHPMAAGLSGLVPVTDVFTTMAWGRPNEHAELVASVPGDSSMAFLFGYETGAQMFGRLAPARRVGFFSQNVTTAALNNNGWQLFDAAVKWAIGCGEGATNLPPQLSFTAPADSSHFFALDTLQLQVEAFDPDGSLAGVEFYANGSYLGTDLEYPYEMSWPIPAFGTYSLSATAVDEYGETARAEIGIVVEEPQPCQGTVLFVVNNAPLELGDLVVQQRLEAMGFTVELVGDLDVQPAHALGKKLVVISSSIDSWELGSRLATVQVPVICYEAFLYDEMKMTGPTPNVDYNWAFEQTYMAINDPGHPMAAGYSGFIPVLNQPETLIWGKPNSTAFEVGTIVGQLNQVALFGYEAGVPMVGMAAPARRVGLFFQKSSAPLLTDIGWALFDQAVFWAIGGPCLPPAAAAPARQAQAASVSGRDFAPLTEVFPNPTEGEATLVLDHPENGWLQIVVSDMMGKVHARLRVEKLSPHFELALPTAGLAKGTYLIQVQHPAFRASRRLIKVR